MSLNLPPRICLCGCRKSFKPKRHFQRFYSRECRYRYYNALRAAPAKVCKTCSHFNFKVSGADGIAWGNCLSKQVLDSQWISLSLVQEIFEHPEPEKLRKAIGDYARIEYREDTFGCRFHAG